MRRARFSETKKRGRCTGPTPVSMMDGCCRVDVAHLTRRAIACSDLCRGDNLRANLWHGPAI